MTRASAFRRAGKWPIIAGQHNEVAMSDHSQRVTQSYGIGRWGAGYFGISAEGHVTVCPDPDLGTELDLFRLAGDIRASGLALPVLVRFTDVLHHRVRSLCRAFRAAADELGYRGRYSAIYPIKVNQQRSVVEELVVGGADCIGLEAGSKPELVAVLASAPPGGSIVCNGYKDREYIRLALIGRRLGHQVFIVIEKPSELDLVMREAAALGIEPQLGVRVRLAAVASGNWQNSGGERSKFGLNAAQVLSLVQRLRDTDKLHWLQLLHSHIGSQIPNLRDIRRGVTEAARFFGELRRLGAPIRVVDVGGGLGIDYEGTGSRHYCSINYSLEAYAREVVRAVARLCDEQGLDHPDLFSESGRAMTAHHALLITHVVDHEPPPGADAPVIADSEHDSLKWLAAELARVDDASAMEVFQEARHLYDETRELFEHGELSLEQRALAERLYFAIAHKVMARLRPGSRRDRELLDQLRELLADKVFCNFSLFQSLPDVWALDQVFPVMPLHRLDEPPQLSGTLHDLTCDSDGCFDSYVDQDGVESTFPMHPLRDGEDYLIGMFLVGAYQEILGDMHNLFGDTDAVNVELDGQGGYRLTQPERGDAIDELLRYVHYDPEQMLTAYRRKLQAEGVSAAEAEAYFAELRDGLTGYSYLED
jgi:arginine decarboxylase